MLIDSLVWILEEILQAVMAVGRRMNRRGKEAVGVVRKTTTYELKVLPDLPVRVLQAQRS